ncbi:MAG TPA: heterodisulfide reductase-related iron-sulfur binding cluster [Bryobacteraceae bacterium]|nr:heterodisulfide reductase-related iron-sulfur binding cluster [Bryobacteraceae bacterium]
MRQVDLDRCIHCGLCLNACPTYRELGVEMDSPRGRIYQMVQVATAAAPVSDSYVEHIGLCLACRACESACPSGVQYGKLVEAARAELETARPRSLSQRIVRSLLLDTLFSSRRLMSLAGRGLWLYEKSGMRALARSTGLLRALGMERLDPLTPTAEPPFFFNQIGKVYPAEGKRRYRVAFLAGCIANVAFARLNEATVRVLRKNGCEVAIPAGQGCCGALHLHVGMRESALKLARRNVDAFLSDDYDAIITNAAGCGSTLKEYGELLAGDTAYTGRAHKFAALVRDVNEFLAGIEMVPAHPLQATVTYQDSCHLAHGQKIRIAPRKLLAAIPGLQYRELAAADQCCGSAGIYNVVHADMADALLEKKMAAVNATGAGIVTTANPGCLLQLRAGVTKHGRGQRVLHVIEILDEAYRSQR